LIAGMGTAANSTGTSTRVRHGPARARGPPGQRVQHSVRAAAASNRVGPCTTSAVAGSGFPAVSITTRTRPRPDDPFGISAAAASARSRAARPRRSHRRRAAARVPAGRTPSIRHAPATATPISITCLKGDSLRAPRSAEAARVVRRAPSSASMWRQRRMPCWSIRNRRVSRRSGPRATPRKCGSLRAEVTQQIVPASVSLVPLRSAPSPR